MSGFFAAALNEDSVFDVYFGTDYHSHLGTRRAGLAFYDHETGFERSIHNIEGSPFRTKFDRDVNNMHGNYGIGVISDYEPQPLVVRSHHGTYAICTCGRILNADALTEEILNGGANQFFEMTTGDVNATELVASLINSQDNLVDGIKYALDRVEGSMSIMLLTPLGIYLARDKFGRTPIVLGKKETGYCASFESFAYLNLGYQPYRELGPGEVVVMTPEKVVTLAEAGKNKKICSFLWVYYGYPSSVYEGISVEAMRNRCGAAMAKRDQMTRDDIDSVAGVPDSGTAHAVGYANESGVPFSRPLIKYTPTWPRSFMPTIQKKRDLIAKMKLIPIHELINGERMLLIDDSIVRGTQLRETCEFLFESGAKEVHVRPACPPILFGCKYLNFSRSQSEMELIARRVIAEEEGTDEVSREILEDYADPDSERYEKMLDGIRKKMGFTTLKFNRLDDMLDAIGLPREELCTYCWNGKE